MKRLLSFTVAAAIILSGLCVFSQARFSDVPEDDWAAPFIYEMADRGVVNGYGDGTFGRNNNVLRCEYAKMIAVASKTNIVSNSVSPYVDVPSYEWYFDYINSVSPFMTGIQDSDGILYFDPDAPATREAVTVAAVKACGLDISKIEDPSAYLAERFSDWKHISSHNRAYVAAAVESGIITGDVGGTFRPRDSIIRAEVVIVLYRAFPEDETNPSITQNRKKVVSSKLTASFLDVGQGDSSFIELPGGETMLIDAGDKYASDYIISFIKSRGFDKINYLIATHPHADHIGGMCDIFDNFDVEHFYMPKAEADTKAYSDMTEKLALEGCSVQYVSGGCTIFGIADVSAVFVAPNSGNYKSLNDYSAVLRLDYGDGSYLFGGDAENVSESEMLSFNRYIDSDVLKVGHHGSATSSTYPYLAAVSPNVAVISCGANNRYGHPADDTLERLKNIGASVYRTDTDGTVEISTCGEDITDENVRYIN